MDKKITTRHFGLIWFGAAVSIAEIMAGALIAPLGLFKGLSAIILGHFLGCVLLYFAGLIGGETGKGAMETVKISFGARGGALFSTLNILQLIGWTAVMIISGARAAAAVSGALSPAVWCVIIGALIALWVLIDLKNLEKLNMLTMGALFALTLALSFRLGGAGAGFSGGEMSFGAAVELSIIMPLSWLPLISDYTRSAARPKAAALTGAAVYFLTSSWMYIIGLAAVIFTGETDVSLIIQKAGLGAWGILIIVFAAVTTTFLDVYSAGASFGALTKGRGEKTFAVITALGGTLLAIFTPIERYESFLGLIGSVFAPMAAILLTDYFILKRKSAGGAFDLKNLLIWAGGFLFYRFFLSVGSPVGGTIPVMLIVGAACVIFKGGFKNVRRNIK